MFSKKLAEKSITVAAVAILVVMSACFAHSQKTGTEISDADIARVEVGKTTTAQLNVLFGEPQTVMDTANFANYYSADCGEENAKIVAYAYNFTSTSSRIGSASVSVQIVTFLVRDDKVCNVNRIRTAQRSR